MAALENTSECNLEALAFYSSAPCRSHHSSLTIKTLKSNSRDIGITPKLFWGHDRKKGVPLPIQLSKHEALPPVHARLAFWCMHAHTHTHTEWEGEYVESLTVIFVKCGLCALLSNSPKTCYSSFCFLSFPLSLFVSKFLFISSSLILPGESEMLLLSFFSTSRAFTAD